MTIMEGSAVANSGKSFCQGRYMVEDDSLLYFTSADEVKRMIAKKGAAADVPHVDAVVS